MPTERFNKLPEDKKRAIKEAAVKEFIRVPFEKASINQMVQHAGISRGSFYTYFVDKRDVLLYIFQDKAREVGRFFDQGLAKHHGDLWKVLEELLDQSMDNAHEGELFQMSRNVFMYQNTQQIFGFSERVHTCKAGGFDLLEAIYGQMDKGRLRIQTLEDFSILMQLAMACLMWALGQYFSSPENKENIKKAFRKKLDILQYGVCT